LFWARWLETDRFGARRHLQSAYRCDLTPLHDSPQEVLLRPGVSRLSGRGALAADGIIVSFCKQ